MRQPSFRRAGRQELPGLPAGVGLDPAVLNAAMCAGYPQEWFVPEPGDVAAERRAKAICAACPVREACLAMAMRTGDAHAVMGGTTHEDRMALRRQRYVHLRGKPRAARRPETISPDLPARLLRDQAAVLDAYAMAQVIGTDAAAREFGLGFRTLADVFAEWGWKPPQIRPRPSTPPSVLTDRQAAVEALELARRVGIARASLQLAIGGRTLRAAWARWGLDVPEPRRAPTDVGRDREAACAALELARRIGTDAAARELNVSSRTLYNAWSRFGLGTVSTAGGALEEVPA